MLLQRISESLQKLGLQPEDFDVLLVAPVAAVAWADGDPSDTGLAELIDGEPISAADVLPLRLSPAARQYLKTYFLDRKPAPAEMERLLDLTSEYLESISYRRAQQCRDRIMKMCLYAADASGGVLGLFGRISSKEKAVLRELSDRLSLEKGHEACQILSDLKLCKERGDEVDQGSTS